MLQRLGRFIGALFSKKKGTLLYLGMFKGDSFDQVFRKYERCYCFEANPELFARLKEKYAAFPHVRLFNVAVGTEQGMADFHLSSNDGASSSLGQFDPQWIADKDGRIDMIATIQVPCINLYDFCLANDIGYIDDYVSDIQGMDLAVLGTLRPLLDRGQIGTVTCEVAKNEKRNSYGSLPDNSLDGFQQLLGGNYELVARGTGILCDGVFDTVPDTWWEMDCKWRCQTNRSRGTA